MRRRIGYVVIRDITKRESHRQGSLLRTEEAVQNQIGRSFKIEFKVQLWNSRLNSSYNLTRSWKNEKEDKQKDTEALGAVGKDTSPSN